MAKKQFKNGWQPRKPKGSKRKSSWHSGSNQDELFWAASQAIPHNPDINHTQSVPQPIKKRGAGGRYRGDAL